MVRWIVGVFAGVAVSAVAGYQLAYKPMRRQWAASPEETAKVFPGDALVPDADFVETLALTIHAPPSAIWPWLVQMGYGRGGWYSYDAIDVLGHSTREIRRELQDLEVGQVIPFAPGAGFRVDVVEPEHALVLYGDTALIEQQRRSAADPADGAAEAPTTGLKLVGALSGANATEFRVSWAFVLEPLDGGQTRLLERFRTWSTPGPAAAVVRPLVDHGHFLMTRKQMLGIKERAETITPAAPAAPPTPVAVGAA